MRIVFVRRCSTGINAQRIQALTFFVALWGAIYLSLLPAPPLFAQGNLSDPGLCYALADNGGADRADVLIRVDRSTNAPPIVVGATGTFNAESMAFLPGGVVLYTVEGTRLGTLSLATGAYTPLAPPILFGNGALGGLVINEIDGLTYHSTENLLYAVVRRSSADLLIRINPTTGGLAPFAPNVDYLVITVAGSPNNFQDIDDLAFDPITDQLYALSNSGLGGELVTINPVTGAATYIADFSNGDALEGLSFFNDGELYASSGGAPNSTSNRLYRVDKTTAALTNITSLSVGGNFDFEGIGCLTANAFLAVEKFTNGVDADLPTGPHLLVGEPVTWTYTIRNTGVITVDNITLVDNRLLPGTIQCPAFPLLNNGLPPTATLTCTATGIAVAGQYSNTATVTGIGYLPTKETINLTSSDPSHYLGVQPDLVIVKDDGGISTQPGNTLIYTLVYSNAGNSEVTGVQIEEQVPANTTFNPTSSSSGWLCTPDNSAGSFCTLALGTVAPGQRGTVNFAVTLIDSFPVGVNLVTNTAAISDDESHGADANPADNQSTDTTPVLAAAELEADKQAIWQDTGLIGGIDPGELVTYTIIVRNIGNQDVINVPLVDNPDPNSTLVVGSVSFTSGSGTITVGNTPGDTTIAATIAATIDRITGGAEARITYRVTINSPLPNNVDVIINRALVSNTIPLSTTVPALAVPDLSITKSDGGVTSIAGGTVVYTLVYANTGTRNATGVIIRETVPEHATFVAAASLPTLWSCPDGSGAGTICTTTVGPLIIGTGGSATFAIRSNSPLAAGVQQLENLARISDDGSNGDDPTPQNNLTTDTTPLNAVPDLILSKTDGGITTLPGATVVYTLTYTNDGTQDATGVIITETVPAHTRFSTVGSTPGWICAPGPEAGNLCTLAIGSLPAGATGSAIFAIQLDKALPAGVTAILNRAQIADDGRNGADPTPQNNEATENTPVVAAPDLLLFKDDGGVTAQPGGLIVYRLDYNNVGNRGAAGVTIVETVPAHTTFAPASSTAGWLCTPTNNAGSTCTIVIGVVAVDQPGAVNFAVTVNPQLPTGVVMTNNIARISDDGSNGLDPNSDNNQATDLTPLDAAPNLVVEKTADLSVVRPGDAVRYTLVYANIGNQDATGVVLRETLPEWTTFDAANSTPGWLCALDSATNRTICTLAVGDLPAGAQGVTPAHFAVIVSATIPREVKEILNVVTIADDGANGLPPAGQHSDEVVTPLIQPTALPAAHEPPAISTARITLFLPLIVAR